MAVRAEDAPEIVEALREDRLHRFVCGECAHPYVTEEPLAWLNFASKRWFLCLAREAEPAWRTYEHDAVTAWRDAMITHAPPLVRGMSGGFTVRTVFGLTALRDKVAAGRAGLDDAWLEVLKLDLMRTRLRYVPVDRPRLLEVTDDALRFTVDSRPGEVLSVPRTSFEELRMDPLSWATAHEQLSRGPYVDVGRLLFSGRAAAEERSIPRG